MAWKVRTSVFAGGLKDCEPLKRLLNRLTGHHGRQIQHKIGDAKYEANNAHERFWTEETQRLFTELQNSVNPQLKYILGCRKRELLDSKWIDFDLERRSWKIPLAKSGKARHVPLSSAALSVAQVPRFEGCNYVLANPKTFKPYICIQHRWNASRKAAGLPDVRIHDPRHSFAINLVNSGRSSWVVPGEGRQKSVNFPQSLEKTHFLEGLLKNYQYQLKPFRSQRDGFFLPAGLHLGSSSLKYSIEGK